MNFQKILWRRIERALDTVANQIVLVALGVAALWAFSRAHPFRFVQLLSY